MARSWSRRDAAQFLPVARARSGRTELPADRRSGQPSDGPCAELPAGQSRRRSGPRCWKKSRLRPVACRTRSDAPSMIGSWAAEGRRGATAGRRRGVEWFPAPAGRRHRRPCLCREPLPRRSPCKALRASPPLARKARPGPLPIWIPWRLSYRQDGRPQDRRTVKRRVTARQRCPQPPRWLRIRPRTDIPCRGFQLRRRHRWPAVMAIRQRLRVASFPAVRPEVGCPWVCP